MWPDENGDWGSASWDPSAGETYTGGAVQANSNSVVTTTAAPEAGSDRWSGWLQNIIGTGVSYVLAKDARESGMVQQRAANGQIVYVPASSTAAAVPGVNNSTLMLIAIALGVVLLAKKA